MAITVSTGCSEELALTENGQNLPFTLYGVLSPDLDTQSVRLYVPEDLPTLGSPVAPDAEVSSTDLQTGTRRVWQDSVIVSPNGQYEYVFWSPFAAEFGHEYRIEAVRGSDGAKSSADVRIPPPVTVRIDESDAPLLDVLIEGEDVRVLSPEAVYSVFRVDLPERHYEISYAGRELAKDDGWELTFNMIVDAYEVNYAYNGELCALCGGACARDFVYLSVLELHMLVGDTVWNPPGGIFEPNLIAQPNILSNVENGHGFIGGGYHVDTRLNPSRETVELACFKHAPDASIESVP